MKKSRHKPQKIIETKEFPVNQQIREPEVRLIDEEGKSMGVLPTAQALELARERGYDLILVSPKALPPVARIMDYGKFQYDQEKQLRKQKTKQKKIETKVIRLSARIGSHDAEIRLNQAQKFLSEGNKVKIEIILKGRERQHANLAYDLINNFVKSLSQQMTIVTEEPLTSLGGRLTTVIAKK